MISMRVLFVGVAHSICILRAAAGGSAWLVCMDGSSLGLVGGNLALYQRVGPVCRWFTAMWQRNCNPVTTMSQHGLATAHWHHQVPR